MSWLEERNYWSDPRTLRAMTTRYYRVVEDGSRVLLKVPERYMDLLTECEELSPSELESLQDGLPVSSRFVVCDMCHGHGNVVNPSIDCGGISDDDFREDPDFEEAYFSGAYNIPCPECDGKRVVTQMNPEHLGPLARKVLAWAAKMEEDSRWTAMEYASERALGA